MSLLPLLGRFGWPGIALMVVIFIVSQTGLCGGGGGQRLKNVPAANPGKDELAHFVAFVFDDVQTTWKEDFARRGESYTPARLVIYSDAVASACGTTSSAVGPFYCPLDQQAYIDLSFYRELQTRFGAPGDFAEAYVIAHEFGHHLQRLQGDLKPQGSSSVALELQADCLAGAWAKHAEKRGLLEAGDVDEALGAASAIGDDRIQKETTGRVRPDQFTHGSSKQRSDAFRRGYDGGEISSCSR